MSFADEVADLVSDIQGILNECNTQLGLKYAPIANKLNELPRRISQISKIQNPAILTDYDQVFSTPMHVLYSVYPNYEYDSYDLTHKMQVAAVQTYRSVELDDDNFVLSTTLSSSSTCLGLFKSNETIHIESGDLVRIIFKNTKTHTSWHSTSYPEIIGLDTRELTGVGDNAFAVRGDFYSSTSAIITDDTVDTGDYYLYIQCGRIGFSINEIIVEVLRAL